MRLKLSCIGDLQADEPLNWSVSTPTTHSRPLESVRGEDAAGSGVRRACASGASVRMVTVASGRRGFGRNGTNPAAPMVKKHGYSE